MPRAKTRRKWKRWELDYLEVFINLGLTYAQIAGLFDRPIESIKGKTRVIGLASKERMGKRRKYPGKEAEIWQIIKDCIIAGCILKDITKELELRGYVFHRSAIARMIDREGSSRTKFYLRRNYSRHKSILTLKAHQNGKFGFYKTASRPRPFNFDPFNRREIPELDEA